MGERRKRDCLTAKVPKSAPAHANLSAFVWKDLCAIQKGNSANENTRVSFASLGSLSMSATGEVLLRLGVKRILA